LDFCHGLIGRSLTRDSFLGKLETKLGRRLRPLPPGRPKGWRKQGKRGRNDGI
jgi:hypothetical protein